MNQQVRAARQLHQPEINLFTVLNIRANDKHFGISLEPKTICSAGMVVHKLGQRTENPGYDPSESASTQ
jgi:hypothetical protein